MQLGDEQPFRLLIHDRDAKLRPAKSPGTPHNERRKPAHLLWTSLMRSTAWRATTASEGMGNRVHTSPHAGQPCRAEPLSSPAIC